MTVGRHLAVGIVAGALAMAAAGCGDSSSGGGDDDIAAGGLVAGLDGVSVGGSDDFALTWADVTELRAAGDLPASATGAATADDGRWAAPVSLALGEPIGPQLPAVDYGFDPMAGERTVGIGVPPNEATRYDGVDADSARSAFEKLGFSDAGDYLALGDEGEIVTDAVDELRVGPVGLNRVAIEGDSLALGAYEEPVDAVIGRSGDPAADVDGVAAASDCLGDGVFAARVDDPGEQASADVALRAVGVGTDDDPAAETLCAVGAPGGSLDQVKGCMEGEFNGGGIEPQTGQTYESVLGAATIEGGESDGTPWLRATFEPAGDAPVGRLLNLEQTGALAGPLGAAAQVAVGRNATRREIGSVSKELAKSCSA